MATWLEKYTGERNRPILVTFVMQQDQNLILKNRAKLPKAVYVEEDFPSKIQERRYTLRPIVRLAANHRNYKGKVTIWYDKMILDNKDYGVNDLSELLRKISPMLACQKSNGTVVGIFGEHSPLSNFQHSAFIQDGIKHATRKHWIQSCKARMFDDMCSLNRILKVQTPGEVKKLANKLRVLMQQSGVGKESQYGI